MNRLNRYARDGSILSLLPNPMTRVDLSTPITPSRPTSTPPPAHPAAVKR